MCMKRYDVTLDKEATEKAKEKAIKEGVSSLSALLRMLISKFNKENR